MTAQEFKEQNPHLSHLEGDALWNAMEDYMLQGGQTAVTGEEGNIKIYRKGDPDMELSPEDEIEYQKCLKMNESAEVKVMDYTRAFWYAFDRNTNPEGKKLSTPMFIVFDVSDKTTENGSENSNTRQ